MVEGCAIEVEVAEGFVRSSAIDVVADVLESAINANLGFVLAEFAIFGAIATNGIAIAARTVGLADGTFSAGSFITHTHASEVTDVLAHGGLTAAQTVDAQTAIFAGQGVGITDLVELRAAGCVGGIAFCYGRHAISGDEGDSGEAEGKGEKGFFQMRAKHMHSPRWHDGHGSLRVVPYSGRRCERNVLRF